MKKFLSSIMAVVLFSIFVSCGSLNAVQGEDTISGNSTTSGEVCMAANFDKFGLIVQSATCADGHYDILNRPDLIGDITEIAPNNIVYTDFASRSRVFLCNTPSCSHSDESCSSFIQNTVGGTMLFLNKEGNRLYCMQMGVSEGLDYFGEDGLGRIIAMEPNGENRQEIFRLRESESFLRRVAIDDENIYFGVLIVKDATTNPKQEVRKLNLDTMQQEVLFALPNHSDYLVAAFENTLVFLSRNRDGSISFIGYSIATGEQEILYQNKYDYETTTYGVLEETVLNFKMIAKDRAEVSTVDLRTGEGKQLSEIPMYEVLSFSFNYCTDTHVTLRITKPGGDGRLPKYYHYFLNYKDGTLTENKLSYTVNGEDFSVFILADAGEYFLVSNGGSNTHLNITNSEGIDTSEEMWHNTYALILKDDYWNNRPNYIPIEDTVYK